LKLKGLIAMQRLPLHELGLNTGKKARLHRVLYQHGPGNGTALFLPYDQGLEHGPRDFFANPASADPSYVIKLAVEGGFNGIALQIGNAQKFYWDFAGEVPLLLKLNGKTEVPPADEPISPINATVADAVALGADAVGYTLYVGSPQQSEDFAQFRQVRADAERLGMPLVVWSYPRGSAINKKGGRNSFYAVDYAARVAAELGADLVKVTWPEADQRPEGRPEYDRDFSTEQMLSALVASSGRALVLLSGGEKSNQDEVLGRARQAMEAGAAGLIFGRNVWQREHDASLRFVEKLHELLRKYG
jgi:class I fructose-bisphosphate aldolase